MIRPIVSTSTRYHLGLDDGYGDVASVEVIYNPDAGGDAVVIYVTLADEATDVRVEVRHP